MRRLLILLILTTSSITTALAECKSPTDQPLIWKRWINEKTLPTGVEVFDRVWIQNPTGTPLILFSSEKDVEKRVNYRPLLGEVPTTTHELPLTKLVNGERYEFHPTLGGGWSAQDYAAALIEPKRPVVTEAYEKRLVSGKLSVLEIKVPVPIYFGKKKTAIEFIYEFRKNPGCPAPSPTPSPVAN